MSDKLRFNVEKAHKVADALTGAFVWRESREGLEFWSRVYDCLLEMIDEHEKK